MATNRPLLVAYEPNKWICRPETKVKKFSIISHLSPARKVDFFFFFRYMRRSRLSIFDKLRNVIYSAVRAAHLFFRFCNLIE